MPYIYNDEDNYPMNEDQIMKYTVYSSRAEMKAVESGEYFRDLEAKEDARIAREAEWMNNLLDDLKLEGGCRKCPYIIETAEALMDDKGSVSFEQKEFIRLTCAGCHGKGTGNMTEADERYADQHWYDLVDWVKSMDLTNWRCTACPKVYEVYGKYKDPDDEWRALEDACGNCKYFGEE